MVKSIVKFFIKESEILDSHKARIRIDMIRSRISDIQKLIQSKKESIEYKENRLSFMKSEKYKKWMMQASPEAVWKFQNEMKKESLEIRKNLKEIAKLNDEKEALLQELDQLKIKIQQEYIPSEIDEFDF